MYVLEHSIHKGGGPRPAPFLAGLWVLRKRKTAGENLRCPADAKNWRVVKTVGTCADALRCCDTQVYGKAG